MKLLVAIFADEMDSQELDLLMKDLEETGLEAVMSFDDNAKMIIAVPDEIPDPDYKGTLEEYWYDVMNESLCPCCHPIEETDVAVYEIKSLQKFREDSNAINDGYGPYEEILLDAEAAYAPTH